MSTKSSTRDSDDSPTSPAPTILMMSLEKSPNTDGMYEQLYRALRKNATVIEALDSTTANQALSTTPPPSAVLVSDAAITHSQHAALLRRLVDYARTGGRVVLGMQFGQSVQLNSVENFFAWWGLEWDNGPYNRTTFGLNPAGLPAPLDASTLFPSVTIRALHVRNVPRSCAVYLATFVSWADSYVYAPEPYKDVRLVTSPAVFTRVGEGFLGFVGDVNAEQCSIRLTIEMCGVKIQSGDLGSTERTIGGYFLPGRSTEVEKRCEEEVPLPTRTGLSSSPAASTSSVNQTSTPAVASGSGSRAGASGNPASTALPTTAPSSMRGRRTPARPREAEVVARAAQRAKVRQEKTGRGDALKEEGNALFREEKWAEAAEKYRAAAFAAGPQPVYMSNLAAALLKQKLWTVAESAASRALLYEPGHFKALFRRAQARKELCRFGAAESDLLHILFQDPSNEPARTELEVVCSLKRTKRSANPSEGASVYEDIPDLEEESDSEDYKHQGDGVPCRFHNRDGCTYGQRCRWKHAPDRMSVRDELGRNVCVYWLLSECRFGDDRCTYAHDRTYLPERGWWADEGRNERLRSVMREMLEGVPRRCLPRALFAEVAKPVSWREDLWATAGRSGGTPAGKKSDNKKGKGKGKGKGKDQGKGKGKGKGKKTERGHGRHAGSYGGYNAFGFRYNDFDKYLDHMDDFYEELMLQGIKPWEADEMSWGELAAIHDVLYDGPYY